MDTLGDLLARDRRTDDLAVRAAGSPAVEYSYEDLVNTGWKTAHFFRHRGVHQGATVGVADDPAVPPLLALFGAAQLGAATLFDPPRDADVDLLVAPAEEVLDYDLPPGTNRVTYHGEVDDPAVEDLGASVWSENPVEPPEDVAPDAVALRTADRAVTHAELLAAAAGARELLDLSGDERVAVRAPLADPGTVAAGVVAPLLAGAAVLFPGEGETGDVAVAEGDAPEDVVVAPGEVL